MANSASKVKFHILIYHVRKKLFVLLIGVSRSWEHQADRQSWNTKHFEDTQIDVPKWGIRWRNRQAAEDYPRSCKNHSKLSTQGDLQLHKQVCLDTPQKKNPLTFISILLVILCHHFQICRDTALCLTQYFRGKKLQLTDLIEEKRLHFHFLFSCIGVGNGNPLQCSCLENPIDRGAWRATVHGVTKSQTWLSN